MNKSNATALKQFIRIQSQSQQPSPVVQRLSAILSQTACQSENSNNMYSRGSLAQNLEVKWCRTTSMRRYQTRSRSSVLTSQTIRLFRARNSDRVLYKALVRSLRISSWLNSNSHWQSTTKLDCKKSWRKAMSISFKIHTSKPLKLVLPSINFWTSRLPYSNRIGFSQL